MSQHEIFNKITAVDEQDQVIGYYDLFEALEKGYIRRVSSIFLFSDTGKLLLQKRADWVLSPNLYEQSAAGHVDEDSDYFNTARTELFEELGLRLDLQEVGTSLPSPGFYNGVYKAVISEDMEIPYDPHEVAGVKWITLSDLEVALTQEPDMFTQPFQNIWRLYRDKILAT